MPKGDKSSYTNKQKRQAEHIEESYEKKGVPNDEAKRRAWATVNKVSGRGKNSGLGRERKKEKPSAKSGDNGGNSSQTSSSRSMAAKKGWETRRKRATE